MFEENVRLSVAMPVWILWRITDYSFWKYDQHNNFHLKMSSELVRNIHFCFGSDIAALTSAYKLSYHAKPCKLYFVFKLLMLTTSALRDYM